MTISQWRPHFLEAGFIWATTRAGFLIVGAVASLLRRDGSPTLLSLYSGWGSWDGGYYLRIAETGYGTQPNDVAFFPLYPLAIRAVDRVLAGGVLPAALLISAVASLAAFVILHRLSEQRLGAGSGKIAVTAAALYPWGGPFLVAAYAEATFLALAVAAWFLATRQRWVWAGALAGLGLVTKPVGAFLLVGLAVMALSAKGSVSLRMAAAGALALVPMAVWMWWLDTSFGSPLAFLDAQAQGWGRRLAAPWSALAFTLRTMVEIDHLPFALSLGAEILALVAGVAGIVWMIRRRWRAEAAVVGSAVAFQAMNWYYRSIPRMLGVLFPLAMVLAAVLSGRRRLAWAAGLLAAGLSALTTAAFVGFIWVN